MLNVLYNTNVIVPSQELAPVVRIAPFTNKDLYKRRATDEELENCNVYLKNRFGNYAILPKARTCIAECLQFYGFGKGDVVTILTSSGKPYISGCVTKTIEQFCEWSREITPKTKLIFVNHEFGYPFKQWNIIKDLNIPIIEDCAYAFGTEDSEIGKYSDFVIYSLPKFFPMQLGAILSINTNAVICEDSVIKDYVLNVLSQEVSNIQYIKERRIKNYNYLTKKLSSLGIKPYFYRDEDVIPGTFLFSWGNIDYPALRSFMESNGIECSVFYGTDAFFIPLNQNLRTADLNYMIDLLTFYSNMIKNDIC